MGLPNIILIMSDNQSAFTLGAYGNPDAVTPNIDQLAQNGLTLNNAFCPNAMCSPCRASVLTGKMPSGHGIHTWLNDRLAKQWPKNWNALDGLDTLTQRAKLAGYNTAIIGKYHLGIPTAGQNGIDHWEVMVNGHTTYFTDQKLWVNGDVQTCPGHSVDHFMSRAADWIASAPEPYFLILTPNGPYGHWPAIKGVPDIPHYAQFADCTFDSIPREGLSAETIALYDLQKDLSGPGGPDFSSLLKMPNDLTTLRNYFAQMALLDDGVGKVMDAAGDSARIVYTSDHGFSLGHHGFWGHGQATWPANAFREAYNIPLILNGPGIPQGQSDALASGLDLFPTLSDWMGVEGPAFDGVSLTPLIEGGEYQRDVIFIEQEETRAVRTDDALLVTRFDGSTAYPLNSEFYDLHADPAERIDVSNHPENREKIEDLQTQIDAFFVTAADPRFDLWNGGAAKSNTSRPWLWKDPWGADWACVH